MRSALFVFALSLFANGCGMVSGGDMPYRETSGHIEAYAYDMSPFESGGGRITLYPLETADDRSFSGPRISGFDMQGTGDWYMILFCDGTQLSGSSDGCDIAALTGDQWTYSPCERNTCRKADERILAAGEIDPIIIAMNRARMDSVRRRSILG